MPPVPRPTPSSARDTLRSGPASAYEPPELRPDMLSRLVHAAIYGGPISDSILTACLRRLRAEGSAGFRTPRMALIKLTLCRRNISVTETLNPDDNHPAYVCGRLMAVFEQIQYAALGDVNAECDRQILWHFQRGSGDAAGSAVRRRDETSSQTAGRKARRVREPDRLLTEISDKLSRRRKANSHCSIKDALHLVTTTRRLAALKRLPSVKLR